MEVLPPPLQFATPVPSTLFPECINAGQYQATKSSPSTPPSPSIPASPPNPSEYPVPRTPSPTGLVIGDFLPLPTIAASPICTPISSFCSSVELLKEVGMSSTHDSHPTLTQNVDGPKDKTPPNSSMSLRILFATPTWISTPPTPPRKQARKPLAANCNLRRPSTPVLSSASFPASTPPHATPTSPNTRLKRCLSFPSVSPRSRTISDPVLSFETSHPSEVLDGQGAQLLKHPEAKFHLPDDAEFSGCEYSPLLIDLGSTSSFEGHSCIIDTRSQHLKDAVRIFHALEELWTTEMDYARDLRTLLVAYIQRLPSFEVRTSAFARASATLATGPWVNAYGGQTLAPMDVITPSPSASTKPIFSENEIGLLTRNLKDILQVHEAFILSLRTLLSPLGFLGVAEDVEYPNHEMEDLPTLMSVLKSVSQKFAAEAPKFEVYQSYCAGHPEAMNLLRRVMSQHPSDWESFEQQCWVMVSRLSDLKDGGPISSSSRHRPGFLGVPMDTVNEQRRHAASTITPGSRPSSRLVKEVDHAPDKNQSRLIFMDYLIKPVQRICKYPLLLEQLKPRASLAGSDDIMFAIENAIQIMRNVAASVDEARRRREAITKSSLIISRFVLPPPSPSFTPSPLAALQSPLHNLTPSFLSSLGPCLLAGSLDVMYYSPRCSFGDLSSITAKYLGAFLYPGGYLILAKIHKGKRYEPRHWFSLTDFEVTGVEGDEAMLPCSFRLSSRVIHFELAAACQREKSIWVQHVCDSVKQQRTWVNTPVPSYKSVGRAHRSSDPRIDGSRPTIAGSSDTELSASAFRLEPRRRKLTLRKSDIAILQDQSRLPNRRSSTASIKSIFAPLGHDPNSIYINRSMVSGRLQVDHGLQDVASQVCLSARLYASLHDEELFPQPPQHHPDRSGFSRSNSAISVAGLARNRLSKQESLRVPRRKPPHHDSMTVFQPQPERSLPLSARRNGKTLSLQSLPLRSTDGNPTGPTHPLSASSTPMSNTQSLFKTSTASSTPFSVDNPISRPISPLSFGRRSSRLSLVRNVKDFFHIGSSQSNPQSPCQSRPDGLDFEHSSPLLRRWRRGTLRRRSRSAPPDEDLPISK